MKQDTDMKSELQFQKLLNQFELSPLDRVHIQEAMTVRNIDADRDIVIAFLKAGIYPGDLQQCFQYLQANGNKPKDFQTVVVLVQAGIRDQQLIDCRQILLNRPQDINFIVEIFPAIKTTKSDFKAYYDTWISKGASAQTHQSLIQCANAGVKGQDLIDYGQLLLSRPDDINFVLNMFRAIKDPKSDFKAYYDFWISKGASA